MHEELCKLKLADETVTEKRRSPRMRIDNLSLIDPQISDMSDPGTRKIVNENSPYKNISIQQSNASQHEEFSEKGHSPDSESVLTKKDIIDNVQVPSQNDHKTPKQKDKRYGDPGNTVHSPKILSSLNTNQQVSLKNVLIKSHRTNSTSYRNPGDDGTITNILPNIQNTEKLKDNEVQNIAFELQNINELQKSQTKKTQILSSKMALCHNCGQSVPRVRSTCETCGTVLKLFRAYMPSLL